MITKLQFEYFKKKYGHAFDVDEKYNLILKNNFGVPQFKLIYVEGGEFMMGNNNGLDREKPEHEVEVSPFYMAEFSVPQEIYKAVTGISPSHFKGINHPVEQVSWKDAIGFCNILNKKIRLTKICDSDYNFINSNGKKTNNITDVKGFRLPTEVEWEFAARGGIKQKEKEPLEYSGSNNIDEVACYYENNDYETKPVGLRFPNVLGIYDMSGNVFEYCWDWYDEKFYEKYTRKNPVNMEPGSERILRGGSWRNFADICRVSRRISGNPDDKYYNGGFRLVFAF